VRKVKAACLNDNLRDGYTLQAVNITNINDVYAQTGQFSVGAPLSSSTTAAGTGAASGSSVAVT
jgi:hypothetical protein